MKNKKYQSHNIKITLFAYQLATCLSTWQPVFNPISNLFSILLSNLLFRVKQFACSFRKFQTKHENFFLYNTAQLSFCNFCIENEINSTSISTDAF